MTDLATALLRDVRRYSYHDYDEEDGFCYRENDVLAALTAALDGVDERAGEVLEGVTLGPWTLCRLADQTPYSIQASYGCVNGLSALFTLAHINVPDAAEVGMTDGAFDRETADANARFIAWARNNVPALLALNAALRAERDDWQEAAARAEQEERIRTRQLADETTRADAAEAEVEKLRGALMVARAHVANNAEGWSVSRGAARDDLTIVDAALTKEADNG